MSQSPSFLRYLLLGKADGSGGLATLAAPLGRDARIDAVRGLALLIIFINHMPGNVVASFMPHNFGFSDAADIFVLLAGVSAVLAYGVLIERRGLGVGAVRIGARLWTLYIAHLAVFLIVCGVVARAVTGTHNPLYIEAINIQPFFNDTPAAVVDALTLTYQPYYLDILPLYIVLLALFPLAYYAVRFSPALALMASALVWQGAVHLGLNFPNTGAAGWFFNPFAWQFLFTLGVVLGRAMLLRVEAPRSRAIDLMAAGFLVFAVMVKVSSGNPFGISVLNDWIESLQMGSDKTNLAVVRVVHLASLLWLFIRFVPVGSAMISGVVGRNLAVMGRHSLEVFCAGVVLSIAGQIILAETYFALGVQLLVCLTGITMLLGLGMFLSWYQSVALQGSVSKPSAALGASAPQS
ncbi:OpgC domain-containing protein [Bosea caraganae]|uniref:OpgC domain-containing protein n=1 Tax=Bosea caraganae TaxID=2763117 RepID=A0A370LBZ5_9HYPH|nr:OpgC domain-containing protein [Bosea caraganae]RDJ27478.1 OpgC domain-containing protein [Bosea caraganae]RDJ29493.1 OpgC domain-containing protein [Bosea caraganae]